MAAWARPWADCRTGPGPVLGRGPAALHERPPPPEPWEVYAHAMRSGGADRRRPAQPLQVLGDGALFGGDPGGVVGDHVGGLPTACEHGFGG